VTQTQLAAILNKMYSTAPYGEQVAQIHLFGIIFANEILKNDYKVMDLIQFSGLNKSYATEVSKGIRLSQYVIVKMEYLDKYASLYGD